MGSPSMATSPTMTIRIEMTMATMGRLMKNFDMVLTPCSAGAGAAGSERAWGDGHAPGRTFWVPSAITCSPGFQSLVDDPVGSDPFSDLHRPDIDLVVRSDHGHQVLALHFRDRPLRHEQRAFLGLQHGPTGRTAGAQQIVRIGEEGADLQGAGGGVNLAIGQGQLALVRIDSCHRPGSAAGAFLRLVAGGLAFKIFLFADIDVGLDRVEGGDGGQFLLHARADQVAQLGFGDAGNAVHRGGDLGEFQVELRLIDCCLGSLDRGPGGKFRADRIVQILLADRVFCRQRSDAGQVGLGGVMARLLLGELGFGLIEGGLEGARVNLKRI
jgi:hypothetical protein